MSRILVLYGTSTGHTAKVARVLGDTLRACGHAVDVVEAARDTAVEPADYAGILVAASVRAGRYQKPVRQWVRQHAQALNGKPTAFVSVCLAVLQKDPAVQKDLERILAAFTGETGWWPGATKSVAGALLYTKYNVFVRWMMKRIVAKAHGDTDTSRDYEYTDWADVRAFARQFERMVALNRQDTSAAAS